MTNDLPPMPAGGGAIVHLDVGGMTCGGCARSVTAALARVAGAAAVDVDVASGRVTLGPFEGADAVPAEAALRDAVEAAGFDLLACRADTAT